MSAAGGARARHRRAPRSGRDRGAGATDPVSDRRQSTNRRLSLGQPRRICARPSSAMEANYRGCRSATRRRSGAAAAAVQAVRRDGRRRSAKYRACGRRAPERRAGRRNGRHHRTSSRTCRLHEFGHFEMSDRAAGARSGAMHDAELSARWCRSCVVRRLDPRCCSWAAQVLVGPWCRPAQPPRRVGTGTAAAGAGGGGCGCRRAIGERRRRRRSTAARDPARLMTAARQVAAVADPATCGEARWRPGDEGTITRCAAAWTRSIAGERAWRPGAEPCARRSRAGSASCEALTPFTPSPDAADADARRSSTARAG